MHVTLNVKHAHRDPNLEGLFEREQERIVRRLGGVPLDLVSLHCEVERNTHQKEAYSSLTLNLPSAILNARSSGVNILSALRHSTDALLVELSRHREQKTRDHRRRAADHDLIDPIDAAAMAPPREDRAVGRIVAELHRFVRSEIERHRELRPGLGFEEIAIADVVEESVLRSLAAANDRPNDVPFDRWMVSCAYDVLIEQEESLTRRASGESLEAEVTEDPSHDDFDASEEIIRRPRSLFLSDLLPAFDGDPGVAVDGQRLHSSMLGIVESLPDLERTILVAVAMDGIPLDEASRRSGVSLSDGERYLQQARSLVRSRLQDLGFGDA